MYNAMTQSKKERFNGNQPDYCQESKTRCVHNLWQLIKEWMACIRLKRWETPLTPSPPEYCPC